MNKRATLFMCLMGLLLLVLAFANVTWGGVALPADEIWRALWGSEASETARFVVWQSRLPSVLTAILAGAALAVAGLAMQTVFDNPLADPSILGVTSGASLGAALATLWLGGSAVAAQFSVSGFAATSLFALAGAGAVILVLLACSAVVTSNLTLLIVGIMMSYVVSSVVTLLSFFSTDYGVQSFVFWGLGDFSGLTPDRLACFGLAVGAAIVPMVLMSKQLNALLLGPGYARSMGVAVRTVRTVVLALVGWLAAMVTAFCGPITFIGLAVPHMARLALGTADHRKLMPASLLVGANIALACLLIAHLPVHGGALPINALTPVFGAPVIIYILLRHRNL